MIKDILKYIFDKENLKTNGMIIVLILVLIGAYKVITNGLEHSTQAIQQQAVSNQKVASALDKLSETQQANITFWQSVLLKK